MAGQLKTSFIAAILACSSLSMGGEAADNMCTKYWFNQTSGIVQNGRVLEITGQSGKIASNVRYLDFKGNVIHEFEIPRTITYSQKSDKDLFLYSSGGKMYHYDILKKQEKQLFPDDPSITSACEMSSSSLLYSCSGAQFTHLYDTKTQRQINIPNALEAQARGQTVVYAEAHEPNKPFNKISIYDFATEKKVKIDVPENKYMYFASDNHIILSSSGQTQESTTHLILVDKSWKKFVDTKTRRLSGRITSGELLFTNYRHKSGKDIPITTENQNEFILTTEIYDKTGAQKKSTVPGYYMVEPTSRGNIIAKFEPPTKISRFAENSFNEMTSGANPKPIYTAEAGRPYSPTVQGNWRLENDSIKKESFLVNAHTGDSFKIPFLANPSITEGENGKNIYITDYRSRGYVFNSEAGKIRTFDLTQGSVNFDNDYEDWYRISNNARAVPQTLKKVCLPDSVKVIDDDCGCLIQNSDVAASFQNTALGDLRDIAVASLCDSNSYDSQEWDKVAPPISRGEISQRQAELYLKRFQKSIGFDPKVHLAILTGILKSDLVEKKPDLVSQTLQTLAITQPELLKSLYRVLKLDKRIPVKYKADSSNSCKNAEETSQSKKVMLDYFKSSASMNSPSTIDDWTIFRPFQAEIQKLPKAERDAIVDGVAERLSQSAAATSDLSGVFQSKLYHFSKNFALDLVGDKSTPKTDLAISAKNGAKTPIILSTGEITTGDDGVDHTEIENLADQSGTYGFLYRPLSAIAIAENPKVGTKITNNYQWQTNGSIYHANASLKVLEPLGKIISGAKSPDYKAMKKDGKLVGLMIAGISGSDVTDVDGFISMYEDEGFEFKDPHPVNTLDFFKSKIKTGEIDYLIKQAHSDGDEKNLFRAARSGTLIEGSRRRKDGIKEVMYLLMPDEKKTDSVLISNQEFGSWVRSRKNDQPLFYLNASCHSIRKVISEVEAAHSSNFVPIPSASLVGFFRDDETNGTYQIINAFRREKNYDEIRSGLEKSETFKNGWDHFLFPDDKQYDSEIRQNLQMNLDIVVSVKDKAGKKVNLDENLDH